MVFKADWEPDQIRVFSDDRIASIVHAAFKAAKVDAYEPMGVGCSNLNIKVQLKSRQNPALLRVYLQKPQAARIEQKLGQKVCGVLPVPSIERIFEVDGLTVAEASFLPGTLLRDVLLAEPSQNDLKALLYAVGQTLADLRMFEWEYAGFFDQDLQVQDPLDARAFEQYFFTVLDDQQVVACLPKDLQKKLGKLVFDDLASLEAEHHLVHGDFDPSNLLVHLDKGRWVVSGILDWEYAFCGSTMVDVANMLRYRHLMPEVYTEAFIQGLSNKGYIMPERWCQVVHLLNACALLGCLHRSDAKKTPKRIQDIIGLLQHISAQL